MDRIKSLLGNKRIISAALVLGLTVAGVNLSQEQVDQIAGILSTVLALLG